MRDNTFVSARTGLSDRNGVLTAIVDMYIDTACHCAATLFVIDNYSIAVMVALNELAARHQIRPHDFVATVDYRTAKEVELRFEASPAAGTALQRQFGAMVSALGLSEQQLSLTGSEAIVYDRIQSALRVAPRRLDR